jgi:hypothetical protein
MCASVLPLGYCVVAEPGCNWYYSDINIYSLLKNIQLLQRFFKFQSSLVACETIGTLSISPLLVVFSVRMPLVYELLVACSGETLPAVITSGEVVVAGGGGGGGGYL